MEKLVELYAFGKKGDFAELGAIKPTTEYLHQGKMSDDEFEQHIKNYKRYVLNQYAEIIEARYIRYQ